MSGRADRPAGRTVRWLAPMLALALLLAGAATALAQAGQTFSLRPASPDSNSPGGGAYYVYSIGPSQGRSDEVLALNTGDQPVTLDLYAVDALTGATTGAVYANQGTPPTAAGTWIRLPQSRVTVPPQSTARVPFDVNVPAGTPPGQYLAGLVAQPAESPGAQAGQAVGKSGQFTVTTTTRVVVAVAVTVPGAFDRKITITGVRSETVTGGTRLQIGIRNDGNVLVKPKGRLVLSDASGTARFEAPVDMDTILPGQSAEYAIPWPRELPAGDYSTMVVLDTTDALPGTAGGAGAPTQAGHAEFRSPPISVKPSASPVPTAAPAGAAAPPASIGAADVPASGAPIGQTSWIPIAVAALAMLLLVNAAIVTYVLRRRRESGAEGAPSAAPRFAPTVGAPAAADGSAPPPSPAPRATAPGVAAGGGFVKGRARQIYLLEGGVRRPFASWSAFIARGGSPTLANVRLMTDEALAAIPEGAPVEDEVQSA